MTSVRTPPQVTSGLQVSFFRGVEAIEEALPPGGEDGQRLEAAANILAEALPDLQRADLEQRINGYLWRREHAEEAWAQRQIREGVTASNFGHRTGAYNCDSCGAFRRLPSDPCPVCGDEIGTHNMTNREVHDLNRDRGYAF